MFRVYSGPSSKEQVSPLERERQLYKEFPTLDEAIGWASHIAKTGRAALSIEGDDGTRLGAHDIANALRRRDDVH